MNMAQLNNYIIKYNMIKLVYSVINIMNSYPHQNFTDHKILGGGGYASASCTESDKINFTTNTPTILDMSI